MMPTISLIWSSEVYRKVILPIIIPMIEDGIIILSSFISHLFQYKYNAITSITSNNGKRIPAALSGLIANDIIGTDNIDIGPGNPPLDKPKTITPKDAKNRK